MMDFIFSAWWQSLGVILFGLIFVLCLYGLTRKLDDEVDEEPASQYKANDWEFRVVKKFK